MHTPTYTHTYTYTHTHLHTHTYTHTIYITYLHSIVAGRALCTVHVMPASDGVILVCWYHWYNAFVARTGCFTHAILLTTRTFVLRVYPNYTSWEADCMFYTKWCLLLYVKSYHLFPCYFPMDQTTQMFCPSPGYDIYGRTMVDKRSPIHRLLWQKCPAL